MSEMTVEQAIEVLRTSKPSGMISERQRVVCIALEMAIKALEENEKLKSDLESETDLVNSQADEIEKLKEELRLYKKPCMNVCSESKYQMSAVEVLEWLKENNHNEDVMTPLFEDMCICYALENYTPQEIVDKIQEYEKSKDEKCICDKCTQEHCEESTGNGMCFQPKDISDTNGPVSNSDEFKVGDWVRNKNYPNVYYKVCKIVGDKLYNDKGNFEYAKCLKHAEPPKEEKRICKHACGDIHENEIGEKVLFCEEWDCDRNITLGDCLGNCESEETPTEEPQVEWVYALYHRPQSTDYFLGFCDTEKSAIETCEHYTIHENYVGCYYRKVCRRKE